MHFFSVCLSYQRRVRYKAEDAFYRGSLGCTPVSVSELSTACEILGWGCVLEEEL